MLSVTALAGCDRCAEPARSVLVDAELSGPLTLGERSRTSSNRPLSPVQNSDPPRFAVIPASYTEAVAAVQPSDDAAAASQPNTFDLLFGSPSSLQRQQPPAKDVDFDRLFGDRLVTESVRTDQADAAADTTARQPDAPRLSAPVRTTEKAAAGPEISFQSLFAAGPPEAVVKPQSLENIAREPVTPVTPVTPELSVSFADLLGAPVSGIAPQPADPAPISTHQSGSPQPPASPVRPQQTLPQKPIVVEPVSVQQTFPLTPSLRASFDAEIARRSVPRLSPRPARTTRSATPQLATPQPATPLPPKPITTQRDPAQHAVIGPVAASHTDPVVGPVVAPQDDRRSVANPFIVAAATQPTMAMPAQTVYSEFYGMSSPLDLATLQQPLLGRHGATPLTLFEAIQVAIASSPQIASLRTDTAVSVAEIDRQDATYDWATFVQTNWDDRSEPVGNDNLGAVDRLNDRRWSGIAGIKRRNLLGGDIELGQEVAFQDTDSVFFNPSDQATSFVSVQYNQPLLRGGGRAFNRSIIDLAVTDARATRAGVVAAVQDILLETTNAYWALAQARGRLIVLRRSYERAKAVAVVVANRTNLDVGPLQKTRADATVAARRSALVGAENDVVLAQEQLLQLILGSEFTSQVAQEVITTSDVFGPVYQINIESEVQTALANRQEIQEAIELIRRSSIEKGVALNQLLPLLSMTLQVSNRGLRGDYQINNAFQDQWSQGSPTYGIGLEYELPIGNRAANASLKQAKFRVLKFQKDFETVTSEVALDARVAAHNAVTRARARGARQEALQLAAEELTMVIRRLELLIDGDSVGQLYLEDLLQTQAKLEQAEDGFVTACTDYALSQFELQRARGTLLTEADLSVQPPAF